MRGELFLAAALLAAGCHRVATAADLLAAGNHELETESVDAARRAIASYEQGLKLASPPAVQSKLHAQMALAYSIADPTHVVPELQTALRLAGEAGDKAAALEPRVSLAVADDTPLEQKIATLRAIAAEAHATGARRAEVLALSALGARLISARKQSEAIQVLVSGLELMRGMKDAVLETDLEYQLALSYEQLGDADRSMPHCFRALAAAAVAHQPLEEAQIDNLIGNVYLWLVPDPARALIYFARATGGFATHGMGESGDGIGARLNMAKAQAGLGDKAGALTTLEQTLATARAFRRDDVAQSHETTLLNALGAIGPAYAAAGRNPEANATYTEAMALAKKLGRSHDYTTAVFGAARLAVVEQRWRDAEELIGGANASIAAEEAAVTDEQLKLSFAGAMRNGQQVLLDALVGQGDWTRAFAASERLRSRRLLVGLGGGDIVDGKGAQALLDADTTLVEYAFTDRHVYALVVEASSVQGIDLGPPRNVEAAARAWYELAGAATAAPERLEAATRALADRILTPLVPKLHGRRLVIVPDRALHYMAFAALPLPDGVPLIERFELVHVPSASVLAALRRRGSGRTHPARELAILADPIFDRGDARLGGARPAATMVVTRAADDLVRLPSTHAEAQAIAALLPPSQVFLAEGAEATRAAALGPEVAGARYVHFATHALLDNVDPDKSGLVFSQVDASGAPVDGFVRVPDIEQSHLAAELVVLSACRTAIGKRFEGEGLVGLTRAFLRAGVPRVVSTLWQVDDAATADLMARFYRGLIGDHLPAPAALRRAQHDAVLRHVPLRLWAGFAFYGDWH